MFHEKSLMKLTIISLIVFVVSTCLFGLELSEEYQILYLDLINANTIGYRSHFDTLELKGMKSISSTQGAIQKTDVVTDFAIHGEGYFKLQNEKGKIAYTRNGSFRIDINGYMVTKEGFRLYENINIPLYSNIDMLHMDAQNILWCINQNGEKIKIGKVKLYKINLTDNCREEGGLIYPDNNYSDETTEESRVMQGFLEQSNVDMLQTLYRMMFVIKKMDSTPTNEVKSKIIDNLINSIMFDKTKTEIEYPQIRYLDYQYK